MDIEILLAIQKFRDGLGAGLADFLSKMTFWGELNTVLIVMALIYWCVSKEAGTYLLMGWSGNRLMNGVLKVTFCVYRPWIRDARIIPYGNAISTATGYSFPSGHVVNASTVYGGGAMRKETPKALRAVLWILLGLVAFSRLYLGVHTPQDVMAAAAIGLVVMWLTLYLMRAIDRNPKKDWIVVCAGLTLAAAVGLYAGLKSYPADYDAQGKLIVDGAKMANDTFKGVGWSAAFLVGWFLERRFVGFSTDVTISRRLTRAVTGTMGFYAVSLLLVPLIKNLIAGPLGIIASCFLQMFYVSFLFPWIAKRLEKGGKNETEEREETAGA